MSALSIQVPFPVFQDRDGQPLDNGYVWLGTSSLNPQTNPVVAYYDSALTIVATQPLRTLNGFISRAGSPAQVYVDAVNFSVLVQDRQGTTVFSVPEGTGISPNASGVVYDPVGTGAVATTVQDKLREWVSVLDFGASPSASAAVNDTAFQSACDSGAKYIYVPPGRYAKSVAVIPQANQTIYGGGRSPVMPYVAGTYALYNTELYIGAHAAFNCSGLTNTVIRGIGMKASGGGISTYGAAANYVAGAIGAIVTNTQTVRLENVSFHGLEYGVAASYAVDGAYADMFSLDGFSASDCKTVVRIGNNSTSGYVAADGRIANNDIVLHCNTCVEAYFTDGLRIENCRFFQAYSNSLYLKGCPYVTLSGVTCFETLGNNLYANNCQYINGSGLSFSRSGGYISTTPWPAAYGINLVNCEQVSLQGAVNFSSSAAVSITSSCKNINLNLGIDQPFYTNGMTSTTGDGAINVTTSSQINLDCTLNGTTYIFAVKSDYASNGTITGNVIGDKYSGCYFGYGALKSPYNFNAVVVADVGINSANSAPVNSQYVTIPAGKSLVSRGFHVTYPSMTLRIGALFWTGGLVTETDGGYSSYEKKTISTNGSGSPVQFQIVMELYNTSGGLLTVPAGTILSTSFAIE